MVLSFAIKDLDNDIGKDLSTAREVTVILLLFRELNLEINGEHAQIILISEHMRVHAICKKQFLKDGQLPSGVEFRKMYIYSCIDNCHNL